MHRTTGATKLLLYSAFCFLIVREDTKLNYKNRKMRKVKIRFKTPISYYGGKQKLATKILERIPEHKLYAEVFTGGAAIFFAKDPSQVEVLNDTNKELMNFYRVLQTRFVELEKMISVTLHSRNLHKDAAVIYNNPHLFDEVTRAWAVWVQSTQGFSAQLDSSWGYDIAKNTTTKKVINNRDRFSLDYAIRLQGVQLEATDARYIIQARDTPDSFFYCDPPYIGSDCGHYDGYTEEDFEALLQILSGIKGKFLLSSYPSDILHKYQKKYSWENVSFEQGVSVASKSGYQKRKVEVLTANYPLES
jgi:DNA adenine methylase